MLPFSRTPILSYTNSMLHFPLFVECVMRADSGVFVYGFCSFVLNFHDYQLIYTSQYWLRSYAIQFIWNMMDNDDGIEWQTHLVRPLVFMCTVYKCKHNHFVHTHAERGRWREGLVWLSATDYQSNLHIAWKWDDFCCRYCEQWTMAIAIYRVRTPSFAGKLQKVPISNETEKIERRHSQ